MKRSEDQIQYAAELAERLKEAIHQSGLTQIQVARDMGVTRAAVNQWLRTGQIQAANLVRFAEITDCDIAWLMSGVRATSLGGSWMSVIEQLPEADRERIKDYVDVLSMAASAANKGPNNGEK